MKQTTNLVSEILETLCHLEGALVPFLKTSFPFFCHLLTLLRIWVTLWTPVEVTTMELVDGLALPAKIKIVRLLNPVFGPVQSKGYENNNLLGILVKLTHGIHQLQSSLVQSALLHYCVHVECQCPAPPRPNSTTHTPL